jgi:Rad3-related DNA helicase
MWKKNVIIDEGHNVADFLFDMFSVKLWQPEWRYDANIEPTIENVKEIVNAALLSLGEQYEMALAKKVEKLMDELEKEIMRYQNVYKTLNEFGNDVLIIKKEEEYHGRVVKSAKGLKQILIHVKPLKVAQLAADVLWPAEFTDKVILMSATVGMDDVRELGLDKQPVGYFESDSPIPKERRPFIAIPVANMKSAAQDDSIPIIAQYLEKLAARHQNDKGLIHCTYSVALRLKKLLAGNPRFWFHDKFDKNQKYLDFRSSKGAPILVASGMSEGIDLPDDCARWQVITKVMYPNLGDDVNQWLCYNDPRMYRWKTVRTIVQQSGRIVRNPNDYGVTYILDQEFERLWKMTSRPGDNMWAKWFRDAIIWVKAA